MLFIFIKFIFYHLCLISLLIAIIISISIRLKKSRKDIYNNAYVLSFLHPFCNDCGGGEKVLWMMVKKLFSDFNGHRKLKINILSCIKDDVESITKKLKERFDIEFQYKSSNVLDIEIIRLKSGHLLKPKNYFTMLLQILGQLYLAFEIVTKTSCDSIIDTTGYPFTYMLLKLLGRYKIFAYVHYPFISQDMINDIKHGKQGVHSRGIFSKIPFMKYVKLAYYNIILKFYQLNGSYVDFAFTNSSWTHKHMISIWSIKMELLYPPCKIQLFSNNKEKREDIMVSFAQFRPEKRHKLQVDIVKKLKERGLDIRLYIIGSVRNEDDEKLYEDIVNYIEENNLSDRIQLFKNLPFSGVKELFDKAKVGIHTMRDEHFGISVIEMMAAGLLVVAHNSAGPKNDIISDHCVGFLANELTDYVDNIYQIFTLYNTQKIIIENAKKHVKKFSDETFMEIFYQLSRDNSIII